MAGTERFKSALTAFSEKMEAELKEDIAALYLFGSIMSTGDFHEGISDINTLVVLRDQSSSREISRISAVYREFRKYPFSIPLMLRESEIEQATDVFAVELIEMQERNRLLFGRDVLAGLKFSNADIRLQCETELRAKIIALRRMLFAERQLVSREEMLYKSLTSTLVLLRQVFRLKGLLLPASRSDIIAGIEKLYGRTFNGIGNLYEMRSRAERMTKNIVEGLVLNYLEDIEFFSGVFNEAV